MPNVELRAYKDSVFANYLYVVDSRFVEIYLRQTPRVQSVPCLHNPAQCPGFREILPIGSTVYPWAWHEPYLQGS